MSLRVQRVLKGSVPRRMHRHMRLLFHHTDSKLHPSRDTSRDPKFHTSSYGDTPSHQRRRPNNHNSRGHGGTAAAAAASANTASTGAQRSIWRKIFPTWKKLKLKVFQPQLNRSYVSGLKTQLSVINWTFFPRIQNLIFLREATQNDHLRLLYKFEIDHKNFGCVGSCGYASASVNRY